MHLNGGLSHGLFRPINTLHPSATPFNDINMSASHLSLPQEATAIQNHGQGLPIRKTNPELVMLGSSTANGAGQGAVNSFEFLPVQFLPKLCMSHGFSTEGPYPQVDCNNQYHASSLSKEMGDIPLNCMRNGALYSPTSNSFANLLGQFRNKQGKRLSDVHFANGNCSQRQKVLINGNFPQGVQIHHCPSGSMMHRSTSSPDHSVDAYEAQQLGFPQEYVDEKNISGSERTNSGSNRSEGAKTRWKPNAVQKCLLDQHFNSGYTRPTPELIASVQGAGEATENQVTVWLKNRASRCKKPPTKKNMNSKLYDNDSDGENPWEDFRQISASILQELSSVVASVDQTDVLELANSIKEAQTIISFGIGQESSTMKAFAINLHHLGFQSYYAGDANAPAFDSNVLVLVSLGLPPSGLARGLIEDSISAGSKVIAFASQKSDDVPFDCHVVHVPIHSHMHVGVDGEVMSCIPEKSSTELDLQSLFDRSLELLFECVSIMIRKSIGMTSSEMRSRHTNLE